MSEPASANEGVSAVGTPPEDAQPIQAAESQQVETHFPPTNSTDIPKQSPFAKGLPEPEGGDRGENVDEQKPFQERQPGPSEQPRPISVEEPGSERQSGHPQPRQQEELGQPLTRQTATPALPSMYKGPDALGFHLSVLGTELSAGRRALKERLARGLSELSFPERVRSRS